MQLFFGNRRDRFFPGNMNLWVILLATVTTTAAFEDKSVFQYISDNGYTTFATMLTRAHLNGVLNGPGPYTLFAPTNDAFLRMDPGTMAVINADPAQLSRIMNYHVAKEYVMQGLITGYSPYTTLEGTEVTLHHIPTGGAMINNGTHIIQPGDIICNNGVVQPIDSVLYPPVHLQRLNIAQHLIQEERFRDFTLALMLSNLLTPLENGDFTVFAPVNSGFAGLARVFTDPDIPQATINQAIEIYKYHIVPGGRKLEMMNHGAMLYTLHSTPLNVTTNAAGAVMVNYATLIGSPIESTNGFIYPVDLLLAPRDIVREILTSAGIPFNETDISGP